MTPQQGNGTRVEVSPRTADGTWPLRVRFGDGREVTTSVSDPDDFDGYLDYEQVSPDAVSYQGEAAGQLAAARRAG